MPLVGFRPTKARLIIEDSNDIVLVMKVVVADSESVGLQVEARFSSYDLQPFTDDSDYVVHVLRRAAGQPPGR